MRRSAGHGPKIARIRTYHLLLPLSEPLSTSQVRHQTQEALLVEITTENGVSGWGECAGPPRILMPVIHDFYAELLLGRDSLQTEVIWNSLYREGFRWGRRGLMVCALSGIDMALWDVKGQVLKRPCSEMMGGRLFDRLSCYATGLFFRDRPEAELIPLLVEEAQSYIDLGFRGVKAQIGRNPSFDMALIRRLRDHLPNVPLMADAGHAYDLPEAVQIAQALAEARFAWLEDPLSPEYPEQYRLLAERVPLLLCAGEWEQTRWGFQKLLSSTGIAHAQVNLAFCGGPTEALHIRSVANGFGINLTPIGTGSMVNAAATLHFAASDHRLPGRLEPFVGLIGWTVPLDPRQSMSFAEGITLDNGRAVVPHASGWGVTIHRDTLQQRCQYERESTL
jgi:D-galactarolactone cycloisomerase